MASFQYCLGFIWTPISGALEYVSLIVGAEAITSVTSMILLSSRAEDLMWEARDLNDARKDMEVQIDSGRLQNMMPTSRANTWLEEEHEVQSDAAGFQDSFNRMEGFSLGSYYQLGRSAEKILTRARRLKTRRADLTVLIEATPDQVVLQPSSSHAIVGAADNLSEIWRFLEDEDSKIIGIYGMGGVGKTTLLKEINNELSQRKSDRFNLVVFLTVSKVTSVDSIQKNIGKRLGYSPTGPRLSEDPVDRATALHTTLLRKKFLLLLDDLWEKVDLAAVGIPVSPLSKGSKIVFTTRSLKVCIDMNPHRRVKLAPLSEQRSWELFCQSMGKREDELAESTRPLAEAVAAKCGGLPLALITVGHALADATNDDTWRARLMKLKGAASEVGDVEKDVLRLLKFSFDRLKDERHKDCLLYCSLFPENVYIDESQLIDYWVGEGFLDRGSSPCSIYDARNDGHEVIAALKAACLLETGGWEGQQVKLHDMVREMALWITGGTCEAEAEKKIFWVNAGQRLTRVPTPGRWKEATRISLMSNSITELPEKPHCPDLQTLLLCRNDPLREIHSGFFQFIRSLTVLDLSCTGLSLLPAEIGWLLELRVLNLSRTRLLSLPVEVGKLTKLRQLNLEGTNYLWSIPREAISSLSCLQSLKVHEGRYRWMGRWRAGGGDSVGREVCLKDLDATNRLDEVCISIRVNSQDDLQALRGSRRLCTAIRFLCLDGGIQEWIDLDDMLGAVEGLAKLEIASFFLLKRLIFPPKQLTQLKELRLNRLYSARIFWGDDKVFVSEPAGAIPFISLLRLEIALCGALRDITWAGQLPRLEVLSVRSCDRMHTIVIHVEQYFFPKLKTIILEDLGKLGSICRHPLLFPNLEEVIVRDCPKLKKLPFSQHSAPKFQSISGDLDWWRGLRWDDNDAQSWFSAYY